MKKVLFSPPIERIVFNALLLTRSFAFPTLAGAVAGSEKGWMQRAQVTERN